MPSNAQRPWIRVNGVPLETYAPIGEVVIEHRWPFGCWEMSWSMTLRARQRLAGVVKGAKVDALIGSLPVWAGQLEEREGDRFVASGAARMAERAPALNSSGMTTTTPDVAIDNAIAKGWVDWARLESVSNVPYAGADTSTIDASDKVNTLAALLDAYTAENNLRWKINERRHLRVFGDPVVTLHWDIYPNEQVLASAQEKLASTVVARWADAFGKLTTTTTGSGLPVAPVDLTPIGALTSARVTTISNTILTRAAAAAGAVGAFTITRDQVRGRPHLSRVIAGHNVRLLGQQDPDTGMSTTPRVVLGITSWNVSEGSIACTPVDAAARDLASIVAEQGGQLA